jgi:hypothetical protein
VRQFPRPARQEIRLGNILPPVTGEIDIRRLTPLPEQNPPCLRILPREARGEKRI